MPACSLVRRAAAAAAVAMLAAGGATAVAAPAAAAPPAVAAEPYCTTTWTGGTGAWADAGRWSTGEIPDATDFVCILRPAGGAVPVVTIEASAAVRGTTLIGASLRVPAGSALTTGEFVVTRSTVSGRGTVSATDSGAARFDDARLAGGVRLDSRGAVFVTRTLTFTGGSRLDQPGDVGLVVLDGDVTLRDGDGHPANHVTLHAFDLEIAGDVVVEVPFQPRSMRLLVTGTLALPRLDGLDADGRWAPPTGSYASLVTHGSGRITLPRSLTALGPGAIVDGDGLVTPGGTPALADLTSVAGSLSTGGPLVLPRPLDVSGQLLVRTSLRVTGLTVRTGATVSVRSAASPALMSPTVQVEPGGAFGASSLNGRLDSAGRTGLAGSRYGALGLTPTAVSGLALDSPGTVDRSARLAGRLTVSLPVPRYLPPDGTRVVLLTADRGLTGQFSAVTASPAKRGSVTLEYTPTQVVAVYHAPVG